jgi:23S rRNA (uracil1939-C5)-methyltransferase
MTRSSRTLKSNTTFVGRIEKIINRGYGITTYNGLKVFVPYSAPADLLEIKLIHKKKHYGVGEINKIITPSPDRIEARCLYFTKCGGCDFQHIKYEAQLKLKEEVVREVFHRLGKLPAEFPITITAGQPWGYRNKAQYPLAGPPVKIGFYERASHNVIDIEKCLLHPSIFDKIRLTVKKLIAKSQEAIYNELEHSGNLRHLILRYGMNTQELLVTFVTRTPHISPKIYRGLLEEFPDIYSITQNINPLKTNRILSEDTKVLYGPGYYHEKLQDKTFRISNTAFFQVNTAQAVNIIKKVQEYVKGSDQVIDLYCGVGVFAITISDLVAKVWGVEINSQAISDAQINARINNVNNVEFIAGDCQTIIGNFKNIDTVIVDPPRKGCTQEVIKQIIALGPQKIIYISCNPTTFIRDLNLLIQNGYQLENCELMDMFPQTYHIELIAKITR